MDYVPKLPLTTPPLHLPPDCSSRPAKLLIHCQTRLTLDKLVNAQSLSDDRSLPAPCPEVGCPDVGRESQSRISAPGRSMAGERFFAIARDSMSSIAISCLRSSLMCDGGDGLGMG